MVALNAALTAGVCAVAVAGSQLPAPTGTPGWLAAPLLVALVIAGSLRVAYRYGDELEDLDVFEAVVAPVLLLYGVAPAVVMIVVAKAASELIARRQPIKAWFNVVQWGLATGVGSLVVSSLRDGADLTGSLFAALVVGLLAVAAVNHAAVVAVLAIVSRRSPRRVLAELRPAIASGWIVGGLLNIALGLLIAASTAAAPATTPLLVVPLAMLHLSSKHITRERAGRGLRRAAHEAADALSRPVDPRAAIEPFLRIVADAFGARAARLVLAAAEPGTTDVFELSSERDACEHRRGAAETLRAPGDAVDAVAIEAGGDDALAADLGADLGAGWRAAFVAPLRRDDQTIGLLYVVDPQGFSQDRDVALAALEAIAAAAASALARADMLDRFVTVHRRNELLLVREAEALESIASGEDLATSLAEIAEFVEAAIPSGSCALVMWPAAAGSVQAEEPGAPTRAARPATAVISSGDDLGLPPSIVDSLRESRDGSDVVVVGDVAADERWTGADERWRDVRSWWAAPIQSTSHGVIGFISVAHPDRRETISDAERLALHVAQRLARLTFEQNVARAELVYQARHDLLTGVGNRAAFLDATNRAVARSERSGRPFAVMFVDLDRFKYVNDTMGHDAGDALLIAVAARLRELVRTPDAVARHGGDEFTVLVEDLRSEIDAIHLAERIVAALDRPYVINDADVAVTGSVGVALGDRRVKADELLERSDAAMYQAKQRGRNRIQVFDEHLAAVTQRRLRQQADLGRALDAGEFVVHYQPIRSLADLSVTGVEALVRWERADGSVVGPDEFIGVAEETGLIVPLGRFVLHQACRQTQRWRETLPHAELGVSVNVSARQFEHSDLVAAVTQALAETRLPAAALTLEITESTMMDVAEVHDELSQLRELGVRIAIDDFGTGYSSLNYVRKLPVDAIKLDRAFLHDLTTDDTAAAIVSSTVRLAETLGLHLVAEGIETVEQLAMLRAIDCRSGQGYHLGRPVHPDVADFAAPGAGETRGVVPPSGGETAQRPVTGASTTGSSAGSPAPPPTSRSSA